MEQGTTWTSDIFRGLSGKADKKESSLNEAGYLGRCCSFCAWALSFSILWKSSRPVGHRKGPEPPPLLPKVKLLHLGSKPKERALGSASEEPRLAALIPSIHFPHVPNRYMTASRHRSRHVGLVFVHHRQPAIQVRDVVAPSNHVARLTSPAPPPGSGGKTHALSRFREKSTRGGSPKTMEPSRHHDPNEALLFRSGVWVAIRLI